MKALIFNSGRGIRMGKMTEFKPKCMVQLYNGETIFERQIRILSSCNIKEFIVTTGPFAEQLHEIANKYPNLKFTFVPNLNYENTNYIVSMDNAYDYLDNEILLLHGDLVFNRNLILKVLNNENKSLCLYNENKKLPEKDFKGRFKDNKLKEVSINIFDSDCYAFQPLYKLSFEDITLWKNKVREFVKNGIVNVYAENALNEISEKLNIIGFSYASDYIDEIDNEEDYKRVLEEIKYFDFKEQVIIENNYIETLKERLKQNEKIFFVCSERLTSILKKEFKNYDIKYFSEYSSNPTYEDIKKGVDLFNNQYKTIVAIGGGSCIDTAKCIKLFSKLDNKLDFLNQKYKYSNTRLIAIPTTAGTGSESTTFAVIYYKGEKISIDHGSLLPNEVILDSDFLKSLPLYQKKVTLLDALSQAIESMWSNKNTKESSLYAKSAIDLILKNYKYYINNDESCYKKIILASNLSGKAINITRTTAPHAMSYMLTKLYNIPHGHAVALTLVSVFKKHYENSKNNQDLKIKLENIALAFGVKEIKEAIDCVDKIIKDMNLPVVKIQEKDIDLLVSSVNSERLKNNPVIFEKEELKQVYKNINKN